jgi:hypothetical protein
MMEQTGGQTQPCLDLVMLANPRSRYPDAFLTEVRIAKASAASPQPMPRKGTNEGVNE